MAVVAGVLLDHVLVDPAQRDRVRNVSLLGYVGEVMPGYDATSALDRGNVVRQILIGPLRVDIIECVVPGSRAPVERRQRISVELSVPCVLGS
jgi:hypothetical protein